MGKELPNTFGGRLKYLMGSETSRSLAAKMFDAGCLEDQPVMKEHKEKGLFKEESKDKSKLIDNARRCIENHMNDVRDANQSWMKTYIKYFNCSADFLLGVIDHPTHEQASVCELTGLTENSAAYLINNKKSVQDGKLSEWEGKRKNKYYKMLSKIIQDEIFVEFVYDYLHSSDEIKEVDLVKVNENGEGDVDCYEANVDFDRLLINGNIVNKYMIKELSGRTLLAYLSQSPILIEKKKGDHKDGKH